MLAALIAVFAAYVCGRAGALPRDANPRVPEIAAIVVVLIAGPWTMTRRRSRRRAHPSRHDRGGLSVRSNAPRVGSDS
jgi:hypothetical protein